MTVRALFLHGAGGGPWEWDIWERVWRGHFDIRAPQISGNSNDLADVRPGEYEQCVRDHVRQFSPRVVVGASMGGLLALRVAFHCPVVVLINPVPWWGTGRSTGTGATRRWSRGSVRSTLAHDLSFTTASSAAARWRDESGAVLRQLASGSGGKPHLSEDTRCLTIASEADDDIALSDMRRMAMELGADLCTIPAATHLGPVLGASAGKTAAMARDWALSFAGPFSFDSV